MDIGKLGSSFTVGQFPVRVGISSGLEAAWLPVIMLHAAYCTSVDWLEFLHDVTALDFEGRRTA